MAAHSNIVPGVKLALNDDTAPLSKRKETSLNERVRHVLQEIFEGYEEFLGCTPD